MIRRSFRAAAYSAVALVSLVVIVLVGLTLYLKHQDFNDYKPLLQQAVLDASGRALRIDGDLSLDISLHPALLVEGVHLANAPGGSRAHMLDVERMEVEINLLPLLSGRLLVKRVILLRPDLLLEALPAGGNNWSFATAGSESVTSDETNGAPPGVVVSEQGVLLPEVHHLLVREARVAYRDVAGGRLRTLKLNELEIWQRESRAPLQLRGKGAIGRDGLTFSGELDSLPALLGNQKIAFALRTDFAGAAVSFKGELQRPLDGTGLMLDVQADSKGIAQPAAAFGVVIPRDFPLHVQAQLLDEADGFSLQHVQAKMADSDLEGQMTLNTAGERLRLQGEMKSARFNVVRLLPEAVAEETPEKTVGPDKASPDQSFADKPSAKKLSGAEQPKAAVQSPRLLPAEPLPLEALRSLDIRLDYSADDLLLPGLALHDVRSSINLDRGRLDLPLSAVLGGGRVNARLKLRADKQPSVLSLSLKGDGIQPSALLRAADGEENLIEDAPLSADVQLSGSGASIAAIMAHARGRLLLRLGKGRVKTQAMGLIGGDMLMTLADKLNPFSDKKEYMQLQCGVVHFRVQDGLMLSDKGIAFETERMNILSEGEINLQDETLDLSIGTEPREGLGLNLSNLVNVVRLGGTLAE
ncbi:MAG: AsmA family protein, partial [Mariprofundaceae bacterium]|nr:AsmA family protein [Mariprofundaceae bacterium]